MKSIESIYFIFFLPLSTYQNTNLKGIFWTTLYITLCSQKNQIQFNLFYINIKKISIWKADLEIFGYWVELENNELKNKAVEFNNRYRNYHEGDIVMHNNKYWKFIGMKSNDSWDFTDRIIYVSVFLLINISGLSRIISSINCIFWLY